MKETVLVNTIASLDERKNVYGEEAIKLCGANTGNVCFVDAVRKQLNTKLDIDCYKIDTYNEKEKYIYVIPASNWINLNGKVLRRTFLPLENIDVSLLTVGIGIQIGINDNLSEFLSEIKKNKETIRALHILSEKSKYIGVRGYITGECLDKLHIHNWKAIGCPSFYEPYRLNKGEKRIEIEEASIDKTIINITPERPSEYKIMEYGYKNRSSFILQTMADMPMSLWSNRPVENRHLKSKLPGLNDNISPKEITKYINECGKIFYSRDEWSEYLKKNKYSFSVGSRFHGNMMALTNGVPALWVMHDLRTREMIETMNLPYVTTDEVKSSKSLEELLEYCVYNEKFYEKYECLGKEYIEMLNESGIQHTF